MQSVSMYLHMILLFTVVLPTGAECLGDHCEATASIKSGDSLIQQSHKNRREIVDLDEKASARSLKSIMGFSADTDAALPEVVSMLATLAQNDTINASKEETHEMVDFIKNFTKLHRAGLEKKRQRAQEDMNGKLDGFSTCSKKFVSAVAQDKASYLVDEQGNQGDIPVARGKHATCRAALKTLDGERATACAELQDFLDLLKKDPPQCGIPSSTEHLVGFFHDLQTYIDTMKGVAAKEYEICENKTIATNSKLAACNSHQKDLEKSFCDYRTQVHATCAEQAGCYKKALAAFNTQKDNTKNTKESLEFEHGLITTLECLLEVIKSKKPTDERRAASKKCLQGASHTVKITIPNVPANHVCNYTEVAKHPCSLAYTSEEYRGMVHINKCNECGKLPVFDHFTDDTMKSVGTYAGGIIPGGNRQCTGIIAAGHQHVCAGNAKTGKLECKGDNGHGELRAAGMALSDVKQLTVGADTTFVLTTAGEIKYFGTNGQSQQSGGARPEGGKKIWSITALSYSLLVRFEDNTWKCYGRTNECGPVRDFLNKEKQVKYIAQMRHGACAIRMDDTVWCFSAHHGAGNVPGDLGEVSALNCGCCWCVAVRKSDGRFKAWGYDGHGEVRNPNGGIYQSSADWVNPRSYACEYHTCYAINQKGEGQRWGWNTGRYWSVSKVTQFVKDYPDAQFVSTGPDGHQFLLWSPSAKKLEGFGHSGHEDGANIGRSSNFELADSPEQCKVMGSGRP